MSLVEFRPYLSRLRFFCGKWISRPAFPMQAARGRHQDAPAFAEARDWAFLGMSRRLLGPTSLPVRADPGLEHLRDLAAKPSAPWPPPANRQDSWSNTCFLPGKLVEKGSALRLDPACQPTRELAYRSRRCSIPDLAPGRGALASRHPKKAHSAASAKAGASLWRPRAACGNAGREFLSPQDVTLTVRRIRTSHGDGLEDPIAASETRSPVGQKLCSRRRTRMRRRRIFRSPGTPGRKQGNAQLLNAPEP